MADPLSVAASIAGLITLADVIATRIFKFIKDVHGAEKEVSALLVEVNSLFGVLQSLKSMSSRFEHEHIATTTPIDILQSCFNTLQKIITYLDKCTPEKLDGFRGTLSNTKRKLRWPLSKAETTTLMGEVSRHKSSLNLALSVNSMSGLLKTLAKQDSVMDSLLEFQADTKRRCLEEVERQLDEKRRLVLNSFEPVDPRERHDIAIKLRHRGTGSWFLESEKYQHFMESPNGKLWLYGIPGAGKTVLCATIIEAVESMRDGTASAFFYCDYKDKSTQVLKNILGSMIKQLALQDQGALDELMAFVKRHSKPGRQGIRYVDELLVELLQSMTKRFSGVILVIDGLDECLEDRRNIVATLAQLANPNAGNVKTLYTSRKEIDIEEAMEDFESASVAAISSDIKLYVASELETRISNKRLRMKDPAMKDLILQRLVDKAEGMFQWVKCQLDYLCELFSDKDRRKALDSLPPTLPATYERILERINNGVPEIQTLVQRALKWIALARLPLSAGALAEAISVDSTDTRLERDSLADKEDIRRCCSSLIREGPGDTLQLSHFSVLEFLSAIDPQKKPDLAPYRIVREDVLIGLGTTCLSYLLFDDFSTSIPREEKLMHRKLQSYLFLPHAVQYWNVYAEIAGSECLDRKPFIDSAVKLFQPSKSRRFVYWAYLRLRAGYPVFPHSKVLAVLNDVTPLHLACCLGLHDVLEKLLEDAPNVNKRSSYFRTPLFCAMVGEHCLRPHGDMLLSTKDRDDVQPENRCKTVRRLLAAGSKQVVGISNDLWDDALYVAAAHVSNKRILRILLEAKFTFSKAAMESIRRYSEDFLNINILKKVLKYITKENLHPESVPEFLQILATYEERTGSQPRTGFSEQSRTGRGTGLLSDEVRQEYYITLQEAATCGQTEILLHCLENVTDIATRDPNVLSQALLYAAENGHTEAIKVLVDHGADSFSCNDQGHTALHFSIQGLHIDTTDYLVSLYISRNQDLSPKTVEGQTPILAALRAGSKEILDLLLPHYQDSSLGENMKNGYTAVHLAVKSCSFPLMRFLSDEGLPMDVQAKDGTTPVQLCLMHVPSTELKNFLVLFLRKYRVEFRSFRDDGNSLVHLIARRGSETAAVAWGILVNDKRFRDTLSLNPNILGQNGCGETPLDLALSHFVRNFPWDEPEFIHILCKEYVDMKIEDKHISMTLLAFSKDLDGACKDDRLAWAGVAGSAAWIPEIFRWLVGAGADVNARNREGVSSLDYIAQWKNNRALVEAVMRTILIYMKSGDSQQPMPDVQQPKQRAAILDKTASPGALRHAVRRGDLDDCQRLIDLGCDVDEIFDTDSSSSGNSKHGNRRTQSLCRCTELLAALYLRHALIAKLLIENGARLDSRGCNRCPYHELQPIHLAVANRMPEMVDLLLERGVSVVEFAQGRNVLHFALQQDASLFRRCSPRTYVIGEAWQERLERSYDKERRRRQVVEAEFRLRVQEIRSKDREIETSGSPTAVDNETASDPSSAADIELRPEPSRADQGEDGEKSEEELDMMRYFKNHSEINLWSTSGTATPLMAPTTPSSPSLSLDEDFESVASSEYDSIDQETIACRRGEDLASVAGSEYDAIYQEIEERVDELKFEEDCKRYREATRPTIRVLRSLLGTNEAPTLLNTSVREGFDQGCYPVHLAVIHRQNDSLLWLLDHGSCWVSARCSSRNEDFTALHEAVRMRQMFMVRLLVSSGASLETEDRWGETPVFKAAYNGTVEILYYLRKKGANIHAKNFIGQGLLHRAIIGGSRGLKWCLKAGLDPNSACKSNIRPIHIASSREIRQLCAAGADITLERPLKATAIHSHSGTCPTRHLEVMFENLTQDQISSILKKRSETCGAPLYFAAYTGNIGNVKCLVEKGAEINAIGGELGAPIQAAWIQHRFNVVTFLMNQGAKITMVEENGKKRPAWYWELSFYHVLPDGNGAWRNGSHIKSVLCRNA